MKHLFIVNPTAGGSDHTAEVAARVRAAFAGRDEPWELYRTTAPMDAVSRIRQETVHGGELRVYACGGDGTFNECVNACARLPQVSLAPLPTGTGNDFCRMFGDEADTFRDLDALLRGHTVPIDLIDCNGRLSANICSVGIDARIGTSVHKYSNIPLIGGATGYVTSLIVNVFKGIATDMHITAPGFTGDRKFTLVCACNGRYYGGGFNPSRDARPDDGELDIYIVEKVNVIKVAQLIGKYASGRSDEVGRYIHHVRGRELTIELEREDVVNMDGEAMTASHIQMRLLPHALNLLVPDTLHFFEKSAADKNLVTNCL